MKTWYEGHDKPYRLRKADGQVGWDGTEEAYNTRRQQLLPILAGKHVPRKGNFIELGCGAGNMTLWFGERGFDVSGADISPTAIEWAREKAAEEGFDARFETGSVLDLPQFEDGSFDFVLDGHCLHCIIGEDRAAFYATAHRLLKPGGYFLLDSMCAPVKEGAFEGYDPETRCIFWEDIANRYFAFPDEIADELTDNGFELLVQHPFPEESHNNIVFEATKPGG